MDKLPIPVGITLVDPIAEIHRKINIALRDDLNAALSKVVSKVQIAIQNRSRVFFETSKEARALISGPLDAHFGIPAGEAAFRVGAIIQTVVNNIEVSFTRVSVRGNSLGGGLTVGAIVADFSDVLNHSEAHIITDKGEDLPWLEWLLVRGNTIIISDFNIRMGNYGGSKFDSRSGKAIMVEQAGGMWQVPAQYSGTVRDNWLTRSILDLSDAYIDMVGTVMQDAIESVI